MIANQQINRYFDDKFRMMLLYLKQIQLDVTTRIERCFNDSKLSRRLGVVFGNKQNSKSIAIN